MKTKPTFSVNATKYLSDIQIQSMTIEEEGAYFRLRCYAWNQEEIGTLPDDDEILASLSKLGEEKWHKSKEKILKHFELVGEKWINRELIREAEKQKAFQNLQRAKALKRWHADSDAVVEASFRKSKNVIKLDTNDREYRGNTLSNINIINNINKNLENKKLQATCQPAEKPNRENRNPVPEKFEVTEKLKSWAEEKKIQKIELKTESFLDYHRAKSSSFADWEAAWRYWMVNSLLFSAKHDNTAFPKTKREHPDRPKTNSSFSNSYRSSSFSEPSSTFVRTGKYDHLYIS